MSRFLGVRPSPPLDRFVEMLWLQAPALPLRDLRPPAHPERKELLPRERVLPTGTLELVINLGEPEIRFWDLEGEDRYDRFSGAVVVGPRCEHFVIDRQERDHVFGVHFRPGGAYPFLGVDIDELTGRSADLDCFWGADAHHLRERLLDEVSPTRQLASVERSLLDHLYRPLELHPAVTQVLAYLDSRPRLPSVSELTRHSGLGSRRFLELFRRAVGLSTKRFCRVLRFQSALDQLERLEAERRLDWIEVALASGYSDQSHFNREFRSFTGVTPGRYLASRRERNHIPIELPR